MEHDRPRWNIVLFATRGVTSFLANALSGIGGCGIPAQLVTVVLPEDAAGDVVPIARRFGANTRLLEEFVGVLPKPTPTEYALWGTAEFNRLMRLRVPVIRELLRDGAYVLHADLDVGWRRNPLPYLERVLATFAWAAQTDPYAAFPPPFCMGFFALRSDDACLALIDRHIAASRTSEHDDQTILHNLLKEDPSAARVIFALPEGLFPTGVLYEAALPAREPPVVLIGRFNPFILHANCTLGLENKQRLLQACGLWRV